MINKTQHLIVKWSISKGRDTYGYNICTIWETGVRYSCNGGGYDMLGTCFGDWLWTKYKERIQSTLKPIRWSDEKREENQLYGYMSVADNEKGYLDGGCGLDCMIKIADRIGLEVNKLSDRKGKCTIGFIIKQKENKNEQEN